MTKTCLLASSLFLLGTALAQATGESAPKPGTIYRSDIDAVIGALRRSATEQRLPALGDDVATTGMVLTAMANCHRRYHTSDGPVVRPSIEFLVAQQRADGSFGAYWPALPALHPHRRWHRVKNSAIHCRLSLPARVFH